MAELREALKQPMPQLAIALAVAVLLLWILAG